MEERIKMEVDLYDSISEWLENYKRNSVKPATYDRMKVSLLMMSRYDISGMNVSEIRSNDIQKYINELVRDGYALTTIKKQYTLLTAYMKYAFSQGYISSPVYLGAKLPSQVAVSKKPKNVEAYSVTEQKRLLPILMGLEDDIFGAAVLMMEAGLRVGEALSLEWSDVDWDRRALRISKTMVRLTSEKGATFVQDGAKSKSSNRIVPLSRNAYDILERLFQKSKNSQGYIFRKQSGTYTYDSAKYHILKAFDRAGIQYKGFHAFRHTFATNCYKRGCDVKILSKLLGHSDVAITYNVYIHLYGDALEEMRSVIE